MKKKIIIVVTVIFGIIALVIGANIASKNILVKEIKINITYLSEDKMLKSNDVERTLITHFGEFKGLKRKEIKTKEIQQYLNKMNFVSSCKVELGILGTLEIEIKQNVPIAKIITNNKQLYLADNASILQSLSYVAADVIIINGYISVAKTAKDTSSNQILSSVYSLVHKIYYDTLLSNQIAQIYVNKNKTFELLPMEGNYIITFGTIDSLDSKIKRLITFYEKGEVSNEEWENIYKVNLSIDNQVICSKKDK